MVTLKKFIRDELGATAIEYGLIAAGIAVAIITVVQRPRHQAVASIFGRDGPRSPGS